MRSLPSLLADVDPGPDSSGRTVYVIVAIVAVLVIIGGLRFIRAKRAG